MTREMNKPDWHNKWIFFDKEIEMKEYLPIKRERKLNEDIAEFFWATCERFKQNGN